MGEKFRSCWTPLALILEESMERRSARRCLRAPLAPWYDEPDDDDIVTKARDAAQGRPAGDRDARRVRSHVPGLRLLSFTEL